MRRKNIIMIIIAIVIVILIVGVVLFLKRADSDIGMQSDTGMESEDYANTDEDVNTEEGTIDMEETAGTDTLSADEIFMSDEEMQERKQQEIDAMHTATVQSSQGKEDFKSEEKPIEPMKVGTLPYTEHRLICEADTEEKAAKIAEKVDGKLIKYAYGIGVIEIEDTVEEAMARIDKMVFGKPDVNPDYIKSAD